jgi:hypothetical protein
MELVIQILILFIVINTALKLSFWRWQWVALFAAICGAFVLLICPVAAEQSKTSLTGLLADKKAMQNMAVLVTAESSLCFAYCFLISTKIFGGKMSRAAKIMQAYPGVLIFPVLYLAVSYAIYAVPGQSFTTTGWIVAALVVAVIMGLRLLLKRLLPEADFRIEVHFLVSLLICILGLISTVNGNVTYAAVEQPTNWRMLALTALLFVAAFMAGYAWNRIKWGIKTKRKQFTQWK